MTGIHSDCDVRLGFGIVTFWGNLPIISVPESQGSSSWGVLTFLSFTCC